MPQEKPEGKLADAWAAALESRGVQTVDVAPGIAETLAVKDASEITHIKKASLVAAKAARMSLTPKIEGISSSTPPLFSPLSPLFHFSSLRPMSTRRHNLHIRRSCKYPCQ